VNDGEQFKFWLMEKYPDLLDGTRDRLLGYGELLREGTDRLGIVSRGDRDRVLMRHVRESLDPGLTRRLHDGEAVLDVGAGGGLPGIPLAILRPDLRICLVEPRERKVAFLERTALLLKIPNLEVWMGALEDRPRVSTRTLASVALSRGIRWTEPMVRVLDDLLESEGRVIRFGAAKGISGVEVVPLQTDPSRAIQVWPREAWVHLSGAR